MSWDSSLYLRFADLRTRPCSELISRVGAFETGRIIDLGCGPGNSTAELRRRWPAARVVGLDNSPAMLRTARASDPAVEWWEGDVGALDGNEAFDLVFSNASLQWVSDHPRLLPKLLRSVNPGGVFAMQIPMNMDAPAHRLMRELAASEKWAPYFPSPVREWFVHTPDEYYDMLSPCARTVDLWSTEYLQVMAGADAIVDWYSGTGLRPFLDALPDPATRDRFRADYLVLIRETYPPAKDGRVLFPFLRFFAIARV